jgi:drug/metabolite transporter (DMT)-like permease
VGSGLADSLSAHRARLVLAFFAIYVLWGSTYLAMRVAVETPYVNPVVALILGHELGGEPIGVRTIVGCTLVLASTIALLRRREPAR